MSIRIISKCSQMSKYSLTHSLTQPDQWNGMVFCNGSATCHCIHAILRVFVFILHCSTSLQIIFFANISLYYTARHRPYILSGFLLELCVCKVKWSTKKRQGLVRCHCHCHFCVFPHLHRTHESRLSQHRANQCTNIRKIRAQNRHKIACIWN